MPDDRTIRSRVAECATNRAGEVTDHSWQIADAVMVNVIDPLLAERAALPRVHPSRLDAARALLGDQWADFIAATDGDDA